MSKHRRPVGVPPKANGAPTKYRPEYDAQAYDACLLGATDIDLGRKFGVPESTIIRWKQRNVTFRQSITRGKEIIDEQVANALLQRALGMQVPSEKVAFSKEGNELRADIVLFIPPDVNACSLWLRNRQPKKWRDKVDLELAGSDGGPVKVTVINYVPPKAEPKKDAKP